MVVAIVYRIMRLVSGRGKVVFEYLHYSVSICLALWQWTSWARSLRRSGVVRSKLALFFVSDDGNHLVHQIPNKRILGSIVVSVKSICEK